MRTTGKRSVVLYILLALFAAGAIWLTISYFANGGKWAMQPYNAHLTSGSLGEITDRSGNVLAKTVSGTRTYSDSETVRKALLHTVGDNNGYINTSVQATMRAKLSGYNPVTGITNTVLSSLGSSIQLTVDQDVCIAAYNALGDNNGTVMVYNYQTGDVLAKVSKPTFDPLAIPEDIDENDAYKGAYLDKNLSASFPPGSIFKLVTQAAAAEKWSDWENREYTCEGAVTLGHSTITCLGTHGTITASQALGYSCNVYYALLARDLGTDALQSKAEQMGFNKSFTFGDVSAAKSTIDLKGAAENELGWAGVGQYTDLANPYHMLLLMGAIANDGTYTQPKLTQTADIFGAFTSDNRSLMSSTEAGQLKELMRSNVRDYYGISFPEGMEVCGKSGTAEVGGGKNPTCWFVGFSSNPSTPYAFVVVVEEGIGGIESAGSAAVAVMQAVAEATA